ncbi:MAG: hypothetical protein HYW78_01555 [Parcubacteria group bacterium]|nr:hypothetical protein [Parcubacteria group bacterium]
MEEKTEKKDQEKIVCRVCRVETTFHAVYEYVPMAERRYGPIGEGSPGRILYYACDICSAIFQDPRKFSRYLVEVSSPGHDVH